MRIGILANLGRHLDRFWLDIANFLEAKGHVVYFAAATASKSRSTDIIPGISRRPTVSNIRARNGIQEWVSSRHLDVIITNTATPSFLVRMFRPTAPVVYFAHGFHWNNETTVSNLFWRALERLMVNRTDGFVTINEEDQKWVDHHAKKCPSLRIQYGVGLDTREFARASMPATKNLVWIGEFSARKRPREAVNVMKLLTEEDPDARLFMLGEGPLQESIKDYIRESRLEDVIALPGRVPVGEFLKNSVALLHTASWEGLPRVALEALATGRPIIGYEIKGLNGLPGTFLAPDKDYFALAQIAAQVLTRRDTFVSEVSLEELSWEKCAMALEEFLYEVVN